MKNSPMVVELRRSAVDRPDGGRQTYHFSFMWSVGRRSRSEFIRPGHMPEADREADWALAWYEIQKVDGEWRGRRRMARRYGDEVWTPDSPDHVTSGGSHNRTPRPHSV